MSGLCPWCKPREGTRWLCQTAKMASISAERLRWTAMKGRRTLCQFSTALLDRTASSQAPNSSATTGCQAGAKSAASFSVFGCKIALSRQHDNREQPLEFESQIAQAACHIFHLVQLCCMGSDIRLGLPSQRFFPSSHALGLPFYLWCLFVQRDHFPIDPPLHFLAFMQNMPNISLMYLIWCDLVHCVLNCFPSVTHNKLPL